MPTTQFSQLWLSAMPLLFVILWSTGFIGAKFGLPHADALAFLSVRYALVIVLMTGLALMMQAPWPKSLRLWIHLGITGLLLHAGYLGGVFIAIDHGLPAGITSLIVGMQPLLTAILAGWLLHETVTRKQWLGIVLGLIGVTLVITGRADMTSLGKIDPLQLIPVLFALVSITLGTLYQKKFCPVFDLRTGAVVQFIPTLIVTALLVPVLGNWQMDWTGEFIFALSWLVLVLSLGAISLLSLLIRQSGAVSVSSLFYLTPAVTALMAWVLFNERLSLIQLVGMIIAISGVWLARKTH
ncbi:MAG: DMT family transporter [Thiofilum sp.]|uniref:DMT family transporter n=1 Tax=Thiofilum sp. TaxID=2212733 RepID=UPI0025FB7CAE|nr:DMT family transporter [Thiofilum sp.]MBK8452358.1 DMT family transporter [Thiofilum sp.]